MKLYPLYTREVGARIIFYSNSKINKGENQEFEKINQVQIYYMMINLE